MNPFGWVMRLWRARQRRLDVELLWPVCIAEARGHRGGAERAFLMHMDIDPAYAGLSDNDKRQILNDLP